jgi:hypothetical protein
MMVMKGIADWLEQSWGSTRVFLDFSLLYRNRSIGNWPLAETLSTILAHKVTVVPVICMAYSHPDHWFPKPGAVEPFITAANRGACIRLKEISLQYPENLVPRLDQLLSEVGLAPSDVDLLVDFECTTETARSYEEVCLRLPYLSDWRTFTISSGGFPVDLSNSQGFKRGEVAYRKRTDWMRWQEQVIRHQSLSRVPAFSDYTVQFARYRPPPGVCFPSASIRYTLEDEWMILRGEKIFGSPLGAKQWTGWAQLLCGMEGVYSGPEFSAGDAFIHERSQDENNPGDSTDWLFASINHHITLTVKQVANLLSS